MTNRFENYSLVLARTHATEGSAVNAMSVVYGALLLKEEGKISHTTEAELELLRNGSANTIVIFCPVSVEGMPLRATVRLSYVLKGNELTPQVRFGLVSGDRRNKVLPRTLTCTADEAPLPVGDIRDNAVFVREVVNYLSQAKLEDLQVKVYDKIAEN